MGLVLFCAFLLYVLAGAGIGLAFVISGATKVLPGHPTFTAGARAVLFPAAAALWPYVLMRWMRSGRAR